MIEPHSPASSVNLGMPVVSPELMVALKWFTPHAVVSKMGQSKNFAHCGAWRKWTVEKLLRVSIISHEEESRMT